MKSTAWAGKALDALQKVEAGKMMKTGGFCLSLASLCAVGESVTMLALPRALQRICLEVLF